MENDEKKDGHWIYTAYITTKSGYRIYAKQKGKRAFRIWVSDPKGKTL